MTDQQMEELADNICRWLNSLEKSRDFYSGFNWDDSSQYDIRQWTHIRQREKYMLSKLRGKLRWRDARHYRQLIAVLRSGSTP
jgi:hypothetical protein